MEEEEVELTELTTLTRGGTTDLVGLLRGLLLKLFSVRELALGEKAEGKLG